MKKISILDVVRLSKNLSLREVARRMDVSYNTVPQYFDTDRHDTIKIGTLLRVCKALGISLRDYARERESYYNKGV